jgi:hypothetical protein
VGPRTGLDDAERRKSLPPNKFKLQPLVPPAHNQSLYRMHYSISKEVLLQHEEEKKKG